MHDDDNDDLGVFHGIAVAMQVELLVALLIAAAFCFNAGAIVGHIRVALDANGNIAREIGR